MIEELEGFDRHQFILNIPDKNGVTERSHLEQVERQTGKRPERLEVQLFPSLVSHIWTAFISLSSKRGSGFSGGLPITYEQIKAYKEVTSTPLTPRDVEAIMGIDNIFMEVSNG